MRKTILLYFMVSEAGVFQVYRHRLYIRGRLCHRDALITDYVIAL